MSHTEDRGHFLTVAEAAVLLGMHASTIYDLCATGDLRHSRYGPRRRRIRLTEADVAAYLEATRVGPENPPLRGAKTPTAGPGAPVARPRRAVGGRPDGKPFEFFK